MLLPQRRILQAKYTRHKNTNPRRPNPAPAALAPAAAGTVAPAPITSRPGPLVDGFVQNEADLEKVPAAWHALLAGVTSAYQQAVGLGLVGVYLRGSLPRGCFLPGLSDVDTFALVLPPADPASSSSSGHTSGRDTAASRQQQQQQQVQQLLQPLLLKHAHLEFTKVEVKVLEIPTGSAAAAALQQHLAAAAPTAEEAIHLQQQQQPQQHNDNSQHSVILHRLTPYAAAQLPAAFEIKTQSVCLAGLDLPHLLPAAAALPSQQPPEQQLLPGLSEDVAAARQTATEAEQAGDLLQQVAACRWSLKRLLRAAFELVQPSVNVWTRDLYWCAHFAGDQLPQLQPQLQQTLQLYLDLQGKLQQLRQQDAAPAVAAAVPDAAALAAPAAPEAAGGSAGLRACLAAAWALVDDELLPKLEAQFLRQMLAEESGWLSKHPGRPVPNFPLSAAAASSRSRSRDNGSRESTSHQQQQQQQQQDRQLPASWWQLARQKLQQLRGSAAEAPQLLLGAAPPAVRVPIWGQVVAFDAGNAAAGVAAVRATLFGSAVEAGELQHHYHLDQQQQQQQQELFGCQPQPLVLRGAAAGWPLVQQPWSLSWLGQQTDFSAGRVRVAPSLAFPFVEPRLAELLLELRGAAACPSLELDMSPAEFVTRLQPGCRLPPIAFRGGEYCYLQAELPARLQQEQLRLKQLLQAIAIAGDPEIMSSPSTVGGQGSIQGQQQQQQQCSQQPVQLQLSQAPRAWVSPAGAVSPLHYDTSNSFLLQARGYKRMLFFSPDELYRLYCYPETHLLRRRSRVNPCEPDYERFPLFRGAGALEVVLAPGDVVFFPSGWAHYTESLGGAVPSFAGGTAGGGSGGTVPGAVCGFSVSITFRVSCK